jgi:predicted transcriptional regulator with HTH domain
VSTAQEIENAIRSLSASEREKLVQYIPQLFPEFAGDSEWERIARDDRPRPVLTELMNRYEADLARDSDALPKIAEGDFDSHA